MAALLTPEISQYIEKITDIYEADIMSIWLIGSRANGVAHPESDWDFVLFGNPEILANLRGDCALHREDVDLLVVFDGNNFEKPWGSPKASTLEKWKWSQINHKIAKYEGIKFVPDEPGSKLGDMVIEMKVAKCIYENEHIAT